MGMTAQSERDLTSRHVKPLLALVRACPTRRPSPIYVRISTTRLEDRTFQLKVVKRSKLTPKMVTEARHHNPLTDGSGTRTAGALRSSHHHC